MLVSMCVGINKQSSYTLAFMSQVKVINTYGDYKLLHHNFTQSAFSQTNEVRVLSLISFIMNSWNNVMVDIVK